MYEWQRQIQMIVDEIDNCIKNHDDEALTLCALARRLGYSEFHTTRKFREISGMKLKDYLRCRRLAFALKEVWDGDKGMLDIAFDYGFSSHEAFTRAFKTMYGVAPSAYRKNPVPVVLRTKINPLDYEQENRTVEEKIERAMAEYDYAGNGYCLDTTPGRLVYLYHDPERFWKYIRPVKKL